MWRLYSGIVEAHDPLQVGLAGAVALLGSITTGMMLQRGIASRRAVWLVLAGMVTGVSVWTTHLTAMLGYQPQMVIRFELAGAVGAVILCILLSTLGWFVAFGGGRRRGLIGGSIVGTGIAASQAMDIGAMQLDGILLYDVNLVLLAVTLGIALAGLAGWLMQRTPLSPLALPMAAALSIAILSVHFAAMAALSAGPVRPGLPSGATLGPNGLSDLLLLAATFLIGTSIGMAYRTAKAAQRMAEDRARLAEAVEALRKSEDHHRASVDLNPQIPWLGSPEGSVIEIGPKWHELVGLPPGSALGDGWQSVIHPEDHAPMLVMRAQALKDGIHGVVDARNRMRLADGSYRWFRVRARPHCGPDGQITAWYGMLDDIDDQVMAEQALRETEERYRLVSNAANDTIWDWSAATNTINWSGALETVFGHRQIGLSTPWEWWCERMHPEDRQKVLQGLTAAMKGTGNTWIAEYRFRTPDGTYLHVFLRAQFIRNAEGRVVRAVGSMVDVSERKAIEDNLRWSAHHDALTLLPNRILYVERLDQAIACAETRGTRVGLILIDLTKFKILNDSRGHAAGDTVLREVARRLRNCVGPEATVARLGGDEFAIILPELSADSALPEVGRQILTSFLDPVDIGSEKVQISLGIGTALWPRDASSAHDLRKHADLALYAAKADHPGSIHAFEPHLLLAMEQRLAMLERARTALAERRILPYYQPKISLKTGRRVGVEALLRWVDAEGEIQLPAEIAAALDDAELAPMLTARMLDRIIIDCQYWQSRDVRVGKVAFNVSGWDFARGDFAERFLARLDTAGLSPAAFEIEITESVFMGQLSGRVGSALVTLRAAGVTVALDDFGTGYASLAHIHDFPVDVLKIDRSFVARLPKGDAASAVIVDAVLQMARGLGITTVAEGIETREQESYLRSKGCDLGQGFLYGRAVPPSNDDARW